MNEKMLKPERPQVIQIHFEQYSGDFFDGYTNYLGVTRIKMFLNQKC